MYSKQSQKREKINVYFRGGSRAACSLVDKLRRLKQTLRELIDPDFGLTNALLSLRVVTLEQAEEIAAEKTSQKRNDCLLNCVISSRNLSLFLYGLVRTSQQHVFNYIVQNGDEGKRCGGCWPLDYKQRDMIVDNIEHWTNIMESDLGLIAELFSKDVITRPHKEHIVAGKSSRDKNNRLLKILLHRSFEHYNKFTQCLINTGQKHLLNGVVAKLRLVTNLSPSDEDQIVTALTQCPPEQRDRIMDRVHENVHLVAMETQHCIAVYIMCMSLEAVQRLDNIYIDGSLKSILGEVLSALAGTNRSVIIDTLEWKVSDYNRCIHYFHTMMGFYSCLGKIPSAEVESESLYRYLAGLPIELGEILLIKTAILMFKHHIKLVSRGADVITYVILNSVCQAWRVILTRRRWNRLQLRRTIRYICCPCKYNFKDAETIVVPSDRVCGVAVLNNRLFVVDRSSSIKIFDITTSDRRLREVIDVNRYIGPRHAVLIDIVCCSETQQLFVADFYNKRIIRVKIESSDSLDVDVFIKLNFKSHAMSIQSKRLLITPDPWSMHRDDTGYNSLYLYDAVDGQLVKTVPLQSHVRTYHAVETKRSAFITCHQGQEDLSQHNEVVELDGEGRVLRVFGGLRGDGPHQLNNPQYLLLDDNGRVLVADSGNRRILLLNQRLQLERVLLTVDDKLSSAPWSMCFNGQTGQLIVGHYTYPGRVDVFNVLKRVL